MTAVKYSNPRFRPVFEANEEVDVECRDCNRVFNCQLSEDGPDYPDHVCPEFNQRMVTEYLESLGCRECDHPTETAYFIGDEHLVEVDPGYGYVWQIRRFTDSDIDGVAVGRYVTIEDAEGDSVAELVAKLAELHVNVSTSARPARKPACQGVAAPEPQGVA